MPSDAWPRTQPSQGGVPHLDFSALTAAQVTFTCQAVVDVLAETHRLLWRARLGEVGLDIPVAALRAMHARLLGLPVEADSDMTSFYVPHAALIQAWQEVFGGYDVEDVVNPRGVPPCPPALTEPPGVSH